MASEVEVDRHTDKLLLLQLCISQLVVLLKPSIEALFFQLGLSVDIGQLLHVSLIPRHVNLVKPCFQHLSPLKLLQVGIRDSTKSSFMLAFRDVGSPSLDNSSKQSHFMVPLTDMLKLCLSELLAPEALQHRESKPLGSIVGQGSRFARQKCQSKPFNEELSFLVRLVLVMYLKTKLADVLFVGCIPSE